MIYLFPGAGIEPSHQARPKAEPQKPGQDWQNSAAEMVGVTDALMTTLFLLQTTLEL